MRNQASIECLIGERYTQLKVPTHISEAVIVLLQSNSYPLRITTSSTPREQREQQKSKSFLTRLIPFMMNAFERYLRECKIDEEILQQLQNLRNQRDGRQHNYELRDVRRLMEQDSSPEGRFLKAFENFFNSEYLEQYILNNARLKRNFTKQLYLKTRSLFLEEILRENNRFRRFTSDSNAAKICQYRQNLEREFGEVGSNSPYNSDQWSVEARPTQEIQASDSDPNQCDQVYSGFHDCQFESQNILYQNQNCRENMDN